jgi:hypothetical protein
VGIALIILSLSHTPLPAPDYHNVRHHDGPGEVCEHHDHLLRWHPHAGIASDVAILHWHWFVPNEGSSGSNPSNKAPALHAHIADWLAPNWDENQPSVASTPRPIDDSAPAATLTLLPPVESTPAALASRDGPLAIHAFTATFAPGSDLTSLLLRRVC